MKRIISLALVTALLGMFASYAHILSAPSVRVVYADPPLAEPLDNISFEKNIIKPDKKLLDAPYIYQMVDYPNGCESVSTVMALQYLGMDIDVDSFIDNYLDMGVRPSVGGYGPDPDTVYCGDPRSSTGWGCYSPVIVNALNELNDGSFTVSHHYGKDISDLCERYIDNDIPVILWATVGMTDSSGDEYYRVWYTENGKKISYNAKLHCLLLIGYDNDNYYFNDPMSEADIAYPKDICEKAYGILGKQSIAVIPA